VGGTDHERWVAPNECCTSILRERWVAPIECPRKVGGTDRERWMAPIECFPYASILRKRSAKGGWHRSRKVGGTD
jgi:hypothetical protein